MKNRSKTIAEYNAKWLIRDVPERSQKQREWSKEYKKQYTGKSPEMIIEEDHITWKRPSKHG